MMVDAREEANAHHAMIQAYHKHRLKAPKSVGPGVCVRVWVRV